MRIIRLLWVVFCAHCLHASHITENVFVGKGESITLKCPFHSTSHVVTWFGPPNLTIYSDGIRTSRHFNHFNITGDFTKGEFNILIPNVTTRYIGCYRCSTLVNERPCQKDFNVILKRPPTNLRIIDKVSSKFIHGTEGQLLTLTCIVNSGQPLQILAWKLNENILTKNQTDVLRYSFIPDGNDHLKDFECIAYHSELTLPLEERVQILLNYKPQVRIDQGSEVLIREGQNLKLDCIVQSSPQYDNVSWILDNGVTIQSGIFLKLQMVNRREKGTYTCSASNTIGTGSAQIHVLVLYPPDITIEKVISNDSATLQCKARGIPANESFYPWQHFSERGTFIRHLPSAIDGTLNIKQITYATNGRYVCTSTNGIPDLNGVKNKSASIDIKNADIPIFVSDNDVIQYAKINHDFMLTVNIYSYPPLLAVHVENDYGIIFNLTESFIYRYMWITDTIFDTKVDLNGTGISLKLQNIQAMHFGNYTFFGKNKQGCSNFTVRLVSSGEDSFFPLWLSVLVPNIAVVCITISLVFLGIIVLRQFRIYILRKQTQSKQQEEHIYFEIEERNEMQNEIGKGMNDDDVYLTVTSQEEIDTAIHNEHLETIDDTGSYDDAVFLGVEEDSEHSENTSGSSDEFPTIRSLSEDYSNPYHTLVKENLRLSLHEYESLKNLNIIVVRQTLKKCTRHNSI